MFSFHVSEHTLDSLLRHRLSAAQLARLQQHVQSCHACSRRVEEWRDNYQEVEAAIPAMEHTSFRVASLPGAPIVLVPSSPGEFRASFDVSKLLWPAAVILALAVGFGASRFTGSQSEGMSPPPQADLPPDPSRAATPAPTSPALPAIATRDSLSASRLSDSLRQVSAARQAATKPAPPVAQPVSRPAPQPAATAAKSGTTKPTGQVATNASRSATPAPQPPSRSARDTASQRQAQRPPATQPATTPAPVASRPAPSRPFTESSESTGTPPSAIGFTRIGLDAAVQRLGGSIRLIEGLDPDHIEIGPGDSVPGAQRGADVVRVIYRARNGGRILLDQQRIPADASGWRHVNDPLLENGDTLVGTSPAGVSVATWVDPKAYWISVVGQMSQDSLKRMLRRVR
ncbi:MAG: hypothetical protein ABJD11_15095 [Gemmatimonadota bacterium]